MLVFGLGTLPVMLTIPLLGNMVGTGFRRKYRYILSVMIVILGILFVLRGLSLGIPYVSPPPKMLKPHEKMRTMSPQKVIFDTTMEMYLK